MNELRGRDLVHGAPQGGVAQVRQNLGMVSTNELTESQEIAQHIRGLALSLLEVMGAMPEFVAAHDEDTSMQTDLWYERQCLGVTQLVRQAVIDCGFEAEIMLGLFIPPKEGGRYPRALQHAWLELRDRTIIDPASGQMGIEPECAIIEPDNPMHRQYRMRGWWREDLGVGHR